MTKYKFTYRNGTEGKVRSDITIEAPTREDAIAEFEADRPNHKWLMTSEI